MDNRSARGAAGFAATQRTSGNDARVNTPREIAAAALGNALEWFDFVTYGYFATLIAKLFFPLAGPLGSLLLATATFGVGFVVRPLGSLILGLYGDRVGRKNALTLTIWLMTAGTALIAVAPPYQQAGLVGAAMLVLARLIQGFAASGEYGSAVAFLAEKAPAKRRNFYVSIQMSTTMLAIVAGAAVGTCLTHALSQAQLESWGWRVPFVIGLLIGPVGFYVRKHVTEPDSLTATERLSTREVMMRLFGAQLRTTLMAIGVAIVGTVAFYLNLIYMPTFAVRQLGLPLSAPFISTAVAGFVMGVCAPAAGLLADLKFRPVTLFSVATAAIALLTYPLYASLIRYPTLTNLLLVQATLAIPIGAISGLVPAIVSQLFAPEIRSTGLSISYNIPTTVFGGFSPLIVTYLISTTANKAAPAFYIIVAAILSLMAAMALPRTR
ncbi:MFS transporter [Paraburkholderia pallida]|uniref:MFS transporter n=1 Tax=Paraburkholderia pallida TaxID=2547399 RepID=A0A4V1B0Y3_9BURK|nr:MFS transporter [Paraburkholderia pallida]QBR04373.1 MFS transporter [Paraburkholderia pallida]